MLELLNDSIGIKGAIAIFLIIHKQLDRHLKDAVGQLPIIHKRLISHLLSNKIITKFQAAYIPSDSTSQQLISMIHQIKLDMSTNKVAHGVFLDVSAAFDAVWHSGLLAKLEQLNIKGEVLKLFSSYLSERRSVTVIDGIKSTELPVNAGVPPGQ